MTTTPEYDKATRRGETLHMEVVPGMAYCGVRGLGEPVSGRQYRTCTRCRITWETENG